MKKTFLLFAVVILAFACGKDNNQSAFELMDQARSLYENNDFASAKNLLDSVKANYQGDAKVQRARLDMVKEVDLAEAKRNIAYVDSLLPAKQAELEAMLPQFKLDKKSEYEDVGHYIDAAYNPSLDKNKSFLKVSVSETGEINLISAYKGSPIDHTQIKVSDSQGNYAETEVIPQDGGLNYTFKDTYGTTYETVTFSRGKDNGVIMFLYNYGDDKITLERLGGKKTSPVTLSDTEKQSIKRLSLLAMTIQEINELQKEKIAAEKRIEYLGTESNTPELK